MVSYFRYTNFQTFIERSSLFPLNIAKLAAKLALEVENLRLVEHSPFASDGKHD